MNPKLENWRQRMRAGDFIAIRAGLHFENSVELAHLIDAYELTGGSGRCSSILRRCLEHCSAGYDCGASALDLWIAIFYAHRGHRHAGTRPDGEERLALDRLARELRAALLALKPRQKAGIMAALRNQPRLEDRETRCD